MQLNATQLNAMQLNAMQRRFLLSFDSSAAVSRGRHAADLGQCTSTSKWT
jgi:hypothetical protein